MEAVQGHKHSGGERYEQALDGVPPATGWHFEAQHSIGYMVRWDLSIFLTSRGP